MAVLATRLPFLAGGLDDIDAVNFALATGDFDPSRHQPHPPGYAVYVLLARLATAIAGTAPAESARALAVLSALAQGALPVPLFLLFSRLGASPRIAAAAAALTLLNPVVWMNGVRPMSDSVGLLFMVGAQALLLAGGADHRRLLGGAALAGLAAGVRIQTLALTAPLLAWAITRPGARRRATALALFAAAGLAWAVPTILEAGGPSAYWSALRGTASDAADVEPLALTWTLNRAVRAARHVVLRPWGAEWLGVVMGALGAVGALALRRRGLAVVLILLAFGPYVVAHALFQQAHTQRYAMPYVPLLALLAVLGLDALARAISGSRASTVFIVLAAAASAASGAVALPGLAGYAAEAGPVPAALAEATAGRSGTATRVLTGHYMFDRYLALASPGLAVRRLPSRREMAALHEAWLGGDDRPILFLAEPRRTDLETIDPRARKVLGAWAWPPATARLMSGERPGAVDLVAIEPPSWFAGAGWGLSLEVARPEGGGLAARTAYLRGSAQERVLLFAAEPTETRAAEWDCELSLAGRRLDRRTCGAPWLASYALGPADPGGYLPLVLTTTRGGAAEAAPFALRGLDSGAAGTALVAHGDGWHYAETAEDGRPFRWATRAARSIVNVPAGGGRLVVEGEFPARSLEGPATVVLEASGLRREITAGGPFRIELDLPPGPPREVILRSDRDFVPDDTQRSGDRRRLALRVFAYALSAR